MIIIIEMISFFDLNMASTLQTYFMKAVILLSEKQVLYILYDSILYKVSLTV